MINAPSGVNDAPLLPADDFQLIAAQEWGSPNAAILHRLMIEIPWRQDNIVLFGKSLLQPRLVCWMGDPDCAYAYSGKRYEPQSWHPLVRDLRLRVEHEAGARYNAVLLNLYRDGADSMGLHADDEPELGDAPIIASLSFGAARSMHFRHRQDRAKPTQRLTLADGSLLVMRGNSQRDWKHAIPKTRRQVGPRVNLTYRLILPR